MHWMTHQRQLDRMAGWCWVIWLSACEPRLLMKQRFALQAYVRDHAFSLDLLGKLQSTQNIEVTAGLTAYF